MTTSSPENFHDIRFPTNISLGARGGPQRYTEVVNLRSGFEERNAIWAHSRRKYNAGYGIKNFKDLAEIVTFFEERHGRLYGFRWYDVLDHSSTLPGQSITYLDQLLGRGDEVRKIYPLQKTYGSHFAPWFRPICKPVRHSVQVGLNGTKTEDFTVDYQRGEILFPHPPRREERITAGFLFDVPVRFDTDYLEIHLKHFDAGEIPNIPLVEIRI